MTMLGIYFRKHFFIALATCLPLTSLSHAEEKPTQPTQLPAEAFYELPELSNIKLSPDGKYIAALRHSGEQTFVITMNLATDEVFYPTKSDDKDFKLKWIEWGNNDRLLISSSFVSGHTASSAKITYTRLFSVDAKKASKIINLVKPNESLRHISQFQDNIIGRVANDPDSILISVDNVSPGHQTVYKVNVNTGKTNLIQREGEATSWLADREGVVRVAVHYDDDKRIMSYKIKDINSNEWVDAWQYVVLGSPAITPLGFGKNASDLYLLADHEGRQALYKADLSKAGYPWELILSDPNRDIEGKLIYSNALNDVVGIYYSDEQPKSIFFKEEFKKFQASIDKVLPNTGNRITNMSDDGKKYILFSSNTITPGVIYIGDRTTNELELFETFNPKVTKDIIVQKEKLEYKARDGLVLSGFLSRPKNGRNKPLATIILPHGGPMSEDGNGFDAYSEFLVNRGYAVFQPNFRGSTGRGFAFMMQAVGNMGLTMQDDLEDAADFLVKKNIADPKRLGILGGSYGGYAALMGAAKTPDLFQCAVSIAGISDIKKLNRGAYIYANRNAIKKQIGEDTDMLKKNSPINLVSNIHIPILLIHATDDAVVPVAQSQIMADELKAQHKNYEYIELEGGSHNFEYLPHRKQTFEAIEAFLAKYLPVK